MRKYTGFTLIEVLIVLAIISILAAIAVPNFMEAQKRTQIKQQEQVNEQRAALKIYKLVGNDKSVFYSTTSPEAGPNGFWAITDAKTSQSMAIGNIKQIVAISRGEFARETAPTTSSATVKVERP